MSNLINRLKRLHQVEARPLGFMIGEGPVEKPKLQLVVLLAAGEPEPPALGPADAAVVEIGPSGKTGPLEKLCRTRDGVPGGAWVKAAGEAVWEKVLETPCDFIIFPPATPLAAAAKDGPGRILELDPSLNEGLLRTVNDLPVDAVLIPGEREEKALTFRRLMLVQRLLNLVHKPVLVTVPGEITGADLQSLWDAGVSGVVVNLAELENGEKLAALRREIDGLAPPAFRKKTPLTPALPRIQPVAPEPEEEEEDGEEE